MIYPNTPAAAPAVARRHGPMQPGGCQLTKLGMFEQQMEEMTGRHGTSMRLRPGRGGQKGQGLRRGDR